MMKLLLGAAIAAATTFMALAPTYAQSVIIQPDNGGGYVDQYSSGDGDQYHRHHRHHNQDSYSDGQYDSQYNDNQYNDGQYRRHRHHHHGCRIFVTTHWRHHHRVVERTRLCG
ncbi:hypothetical protein C7I87_24220 [Mesorhizobium sp. SARCC-RB16n]|nr:hypothetical protein C7I87_24220 [Mesorhizobium sp. SARCC-RB16n]